MNIFKRYTVNAKLLVLAFLSLPLGGVGEGLAQTKSTLRIDATKTHQHITGFGGFVCSPQFTYNHMSESEIKKMWGKSSTVGCNIMRLYIPIGKNAWGQSLNTAKLAKQMGLIVFASPWGQPAEWKTNNSSNAKTDDGKEGRLKRENWADYAKYLDDYVKYLRQNGVELDAISIQNEPDWAASYAGCLWSTSEMAEFVKTYGRTISCKIMAPESIGCSDSYVNALNASGVIDGFDIYGGHQYGGIGSAYKNLAKKGKEIWMTEYLINWNEIENNERNFDFTKDFFNFYRAINTCMLGDFNAWIHYAAKRYYAMMGDGQRGAGSSGTITKRGYIMAHFAKFVTGMTRIEGTFTDGGMEGTYYQSASGDTIVAVLANNSDETYTLTVDLPFYTEEGKQYTTTQTKNFTLTNIKPDVETCRPVATVAAQSVVTLLFTRSRERMASNMKGTTKRFDRIDDMTPSRNTFGTNYKLSGKSKTFDHENPLISTRTNIALGYLELDNRYSKLVFNIKKVTSAANYTSSQTTLVYVNREGKLAKHDYGEINLGARENFSIVFDISPRTLPDGCIGVVSLTNNNYNSKLTINFGDVYFANEGQYSATLSGAYVADDSYLLDYTTDPSCTSIDLTSVTEIPAELPWLTGTNKVVYVSDDYAGSNPNIIKNGICNQLELSTTGGDFRPLSAFTANEATLTIEGDGIWIFVSPFSAQIPAGYIAFVINDDLSTTQMRSIPANKPILLFENVIPEAPTRSEFSEPMTIHGGGEVAPEKCPSTTKIQYSYTDTPVYPGDYVFDNEQFGFVRVTEATTLPPFSIYAQFDSTDDFIPLKREDTAIKEVRSERLEVRSNVFDLSGKHITPHKGGDGGSLPNGINIIDGRKVFVK
ncbi:MAG: hypothetical protein J5770_05655 [Bacteroidaceae bacterium]|nr:hypothetical protein [Bacteroidaceae bacterium]